MTALWGVIPAAGSGARMGGATPKQYLRAGGATLLEHSLRALLSLPEVAAVCVALQAGDTTAARLPSLAAARVQTVTGGEQRSASVLAGLDALAGRAAADDWVLVHDAARPCVRGADIAALVAAVRGSGVGGLLAEPVVDTVKRVDDAGRVVVTLDRSGLWRAQTPQMFRLGELRAALLRARDADRPVTDEASAMEWAGYPVQVVPGSGENLKVTVAVDLRLAEFYLQQRQQPA